MPWFVSRIWLGAPIVLLTLTLRADELPRGFAATGPAGSAVMTLLQMPDVQAELELSRQQESQFAAWKAAHRRERRQFFQNLIAGNVFDEPVDAASRRAWLDLWNQDFEDRLMAQLLTEEQSSRIRQLRLQLLGPQAVFDESVAERLQLSPLQMRQLTAERRTWNAQMPARAERTQPSFQEAVLSPRQLAKLREMQGEPFAFSALRNIAKRHSAAIATDAEQFAVHRGRTRGESETKRSPVQVLFR